MPENNVTRIIFEHANDLATNISKILTTPFVLLAIVDKAEGELKETLESFNLTVDNIGRLVINSVNEPEGLLRHIVSNAERMAQLSKSNVALVHIMLGLLVLPVTLAREILSVLEVDFSLLQARLYQIAGIQQPAIQSGRKYRQSQTQIQLEPIRLGANSVLMTCAKDITLLAQQGKLDSVMGRDEEIKRALRILCRRTKSNLVFIGEAGVGKTAIVEGIARIIAFQEKSLPKKLKGSRIFALNASSLVAGTSFRGQFEARMQELLKELREHPEIILFLDELHTIVGAGACVDSNMDIGNIMKPALAKGEIRCIGATTLDEYRKIEKDEALERRFQPIIVNPPSEKLALQILQKIIGKYEMFHNVHYEDEALKAAVKLSIQYIPDRNLPDKAIDIVDEAGARAAMDGRKIITEDDIAKIVRDWTGIMLITPKEQKTRILELEKNLKAKVIGQDPAIETIARRMVALRQPNRPIGSFIFLGPTGVGKTLLAKKLAEELFGNENAMIRLDMSEYQEKHSISKLIGAPPGYVGYEEGGQLTEKVRRKPFSVVLFDEIKKAHQDVFDLLLQILDDGQLTDGQGKTVNFKNTIIIMTSNIMPEAGTGVGIGFGVVESGEANKLVISLRERGFQMEFLNRVDDIVLFNYLGAKSLEQIVSLELKKAGELLEEQGIKLEEISQEVKDYLIFKGFKQEYGARELRRTVEKLILAPLGQKILEEKFKKGGKVKIELQEDKLVFNAG